MKLSHAAQGRDNNFNLLRITAAMAVLISHSFPLALGRVANEPLHASLGITLGSIGVDIFFLTSGFLVTGSLLSRHSALEFFWSRLIRVYPALITMTVLTVFLLGPCMTTVPLSTYFSEPMTYLYLLKNSTLLHGVAYTLPGVFTTTAYPDAVNGALWSMPYELSMYLILLLLWCLLRLTGQARLTIMRIVLPLMACCAALNYLPRHFPGAGDSYVHGLFFMFFVGASYYILQEKIVLSSRLFIIAATALMLASLAGQYSFFLTYALTLPYLLFFIAFVPAGLLRQYNRLGDYSYGLYIYAFPVQQCVAALLPQVSVWQMVILSGITTLTLAAASWHLLEHAALGRKNMYIAGSKRLWTRYCPGIFRRSPDL
jgi:peptidoglycan/LPS O-acetylase OafA/YrhL